MRKYLGLLGLVFFMSADVNALVDARALSREEQFVNDLGNQIISLIKSTEDMGAKKEHFRDMLQKNFDMNSIGKFVLSRHWRVASDAQKKEFLKLFEQNMVDTYTSQFNKYKDESMQVQNSRKEKDGGIWVNTLVHGEAKDPLNIRWKLYEVNGQFKVYDIYVNEVSMGITHRSEYASIIDSKGGNVDGLLKAMRDNTTSRKDK